METEFRINPEVNGLRVIVEAPERTAEAEGLLERLAAEEGERLPGFQGDRVTGLRPEDILRFYGEDKEVRAQTAEGVYTVRLRLYELEERFAPRRFVRISHSEIVNWRKVAALDLKLTGTIRVTLEGGVTAYVSRRYVKRIKEVLGI